MLIFAVFSGVSITLVIPLFDFIFVSTDTIEPIYNTLPDFFTAFFDTIRDTFVEYKFSLSVNYLNNYITPLNNVLTQTDSWLLLKLIC